jgi:hypothetical protein
VFDERPLKAVILEYCVLDVVHMLELWKLYNARIDGFWEVMVSEAAVERVRESQMSSYTPTGRHKALGCWSEIGIREARIREAGIREARMRWNNGRREELYGGK